MEYNGHRSWNAWNVSLWIHNDEHLYRTASALVKDLGPTKAARQLHRLLEGTRTPDGAAYNLTAIREALSNWG